MKKTSLFIFAGIFILSLGAFYLIDQSSSKTEGDAPQGSASGEELPEINWKMLQEFDLNTGVGPDELMELDGKIIRMPGFVVPLTDDYTELQEFLLVPNAQACIHVPPPPANLIVTVKLREPVPADESTNPAWVIGRFKIETTEVNMGAQHTK